MRIEINLDEGKSSMLTSWRKSTSIIFDVLIPRANESFSIKTCYLIDMNV